MIKLLKIAFESKRYLILLGFTVILSLLITVASQMEAFSMGLLTNQGPDFFALFSNKPKNEKPASKPSKGAVNKYLEKKRRQTGVEAKVSVKDVQEKWVEIDKEGKGYITKADATNYMNQRKNFNLLQSLMQKTKEKYKIANNIALLFLIFGLVGIFRVSCTFLSRYTTTLVGSFISKSLRERYFKHLQTLPMSFFQKHNIGGLSQRITGDAGAVSSAIIAFITNYCQMPFTFITSLIILFKVSFDLSLIVFVGLPLVGLPIVYLSKKTKQMQRKMQRYGDQFAHLLIDYLAGVHTVKLFNMEKFSSKKYSEMNTLATKTELRISLYSFISRPILHFIGNIFLASVIIYGLYFAKMSVSDLVIYTAVLHLFYEPIKKFGEENINIQRGLAAAERLFEILETKSDIIDKPNAVEFNNFKEKIEFKNIWFKYDKEWILKDLSFTVNKGDFVAIVGPTGAGKSTIANLIPRLYDVQKGSIEIDGISLKNYKQKSLREGISSISQKPFLFCDTVKGNICYGRNYSEEQIKLAAKRANSDEFIEKLPEKYNTMLAEMGKSLSGGQQQRLALTRALVKNAPIFIMDEATSALDSVSEDKIKQAISQLKGSMTQIVIAHRLSTIEDADKIIYMEYGSILAQGTKDELYSTCEGFRAMWDMMFKKEIELAQSATTV